MMDLTKLAHVLGENPDNYNPYKNCDQMMDLIEKLHIGYNIYSIGDITYVECSNSSKTISVYAMLSSSKTDLNHTMYVGDTIRECIMYGITQVAIILLT